MSQPVIPDTGAYLVLGLVVFAGIFTGFLASLYARYLNLRRDLRLIEQIETSERS